MGELRKQYTEKELDIMYEVGTRKVPLSEIEKKLDREGNGIVFKLWKLSKENPRKWAKMYEYYYRQYHSENREQIREKEIERKHARREEIKSMVHRVLSSQEYSYF